MERRPNFPDAFHGGKKLPPALLDQMRAARGRGEGNLLTREDWEDSGAVPCDAFGIPTTRRARGRERRKRRCARGDWGRGQAAGRQQETSSRKRRAGAARGEAAARPENPPGAGEAARRERRGASPLANALLGRGRRRAYWKRAGSSSRSMKSGSTRLRYCCQH